MNQSEIIVSQYEKIKIPCNRNFKKGVNDEFLIACFEYGFRTAVNTMRVGLELLTDSDLHDYAVDFVSFFHGNNLPKEVFNEYVASKKKQVFEEYTILKTRSIEQWFLVYKSKFDNFSSISKYLNAIEIHMKNIEFFDKGLTY